MKRSLWMAAITNAWPVIRPLVPAHAWPRSERPAKDVPRLDGHPDLSGVWWRGADDGMRASTRGYVAPIGGPAATPAAGAPRPTAFAGLYQPSALCQG